MKSSMCENCIKYKTIYCPNSDECLARENKPFYEDKYTILTRKEVLEEILIDLQQENQKYKEVIDKAVLELVNIDGNLSNSQLSDRICNLIDILQTLEDKEETDTNAGEA